MLNLHHFVGGITQDTIGKSFVFRQDSYFFLYLVTEVTPSSDL